MADAGGTTPQWSGRRDTRLICQAVLGGWDIPKVERPEILAYLQSDLDNGKGRGLDRMQAAINRLKSDTRAALIAAPGTG
jgi:hypothetical protein